ncbi:MAG: hypothetical protein WC980_01345 [Candidatus Brocadiia bacterium]
MNKRPLIIKIILFLLIWGCALSIFKLSYLFILYGKNIIYADTFSFVYIYIALMGLLSLISAVGIWRAKKWGWWIGALRFMCNALWNANRFIWIPLGFIGTASKYSSAKYCLEYGGFGLVSAFLFMLFFNKNALEYFGLQQQPKIKAIVILFVIALTIVAVLNMPSLIFIYRHI